MIYLASRSPRRRELLRQIGVEFSPLDVDVDESRDAMEPARAYVERLAIAKARAGRKLLEHPEGVVIGADTAVVLDEQILGQPRDAAHARSMLSQLSGREHRVLTGVATAASRERSAVSETRVWFRSIDAAECARYVATGEPLDKAGAYAAQGLAAVFIERIDGSYSGVVGLPLFETALMLREAARGR